MGRRSPQVGILSARKPAFIFPGQGSQSVGMGKDLAAGFDCARDIFRRADSALGWELSRLCFDGPEDQLAETINTQPALFVTSVAAYEVVRQRRLSPAFAAGHSVGEYAALYAAGAIGFEECLRLVRRRAELMQEAARRNPGTMAAVLGLSVDQVREVVSKASEFGVVAAANFNSPTQTVISGEARAVQRASEIAMEMGAKRVVALKVSGAFHSPLMEEAAAELASVLEKTQISDPVVPVVANCTADFETTAADVRTNLSNQITGSVRWIESVSRMLDSGADVFIELGPGTVLAGLVKRIAPQANVHSIGDRRSLEDALG